MQYGRVTRDILPSDRKTYQMESLEGELKSYRKANEKNLLLRLLVHILHH